MIISFKNESNQNQPERQLTAVVRKKQVSSVSLWKDPPPPPPPTPRSVVSSGVCAQETARVRVLVCPQVQSQICVLQSAICIAEGSVSEEG